MVRLSMIASAKAVMAIASLSLVAQVSPLTGVPGVDAATRWTLDGALVVAVGCLVKAVVALFKINAADRAEAAVIARAKDEQVLSMVTKVTEALAVNSQAWQAANTTIGSNRAAIDELRQEFREEHATPKRGR
jgi:phosphoglycolate phosphatase-like HAD superfamily hydrolase